MPVRAKLAMQHLSLMLTKPLSATAERLSRQGLGWMAQGSDLMWSNWPVLASAKLQDRLGIMRV